jgi:hypothetical protein
MPTTSRLPTLRELSLDQLHEMSFADLRELSEEAENRHKTIKSALLNAAIKEAMASVRFGHLSKVAREAGISSQYLRDLIEDQHPGWLDRAAEEREKEKAARGRTKGTRKRLSGQQ